MSENIKRYLQIVLIVVLSLFHCSVIVVLKLKSFDLKYRLQQRLVMCHASGDFLRHVFEKSGKIIRTAILLYYLNESFNKIEIEIDSENKVS